MTEKEKYQILMLSWEGYGAKRISQKLGINENTIKSFLKRSKHDPKKDQCLECGADLVQLPHRKKKKYCSDACRLAWWAKHPERGTRTMTTLICEYCGKEFEVNGAKKQKFCSRDCYAKKRTETNRQNKERALAEKVPCRARVSDLPLDCICPSCKWFVEGKRSCPCKRAASENI